MGENAWEQVVDSVVLDAEDDYAVHEADSGRGIKRDYVFEFASEVGRQEQLRLVVCLEQEYLIGPTLKVSGIPDW